MNTLQKIKNLFWVRSLKDYFDRYEKYLLPGALVVGLLIDALTFRNINIDTAFSLLTSYLVISILTIAYIHAFKEKIFPETKIWESIYVYSPLVIQFTFGALLSAIFIFYFFSGTVWVSWPIFLALVILMIVNDSFREYYLKAEVQLGIFYFILLLFLILVFPFLMNKIGPGIFFLSGAASLVIFFGLLKLLLYLSTEVDIKRKGIATIVILIFSVVNILYFTNIIPPIPLSVRDSGVYYRVDRINGNYQVVAPQSSWKDYFISSNKIKFSEESEIFVYTAVFAPSDLTEEIIHEWQYYDSENEKWDSTDELSFYLVGGRDGGYRGYSKKSNLKEGHWRVKVETQEGKVLDIIDFELTKTEDSIKTVERLKR
ncbi:MAG: DUF2914 domain-containing protein [Candidatus Magasanikbacteria bacterium]